MELVVLLFRRMLPASFIIVALGFASQIAKGLTINLKLGGEAGHVIVDLGDGREWLTGPYYGTVVKIPSPAPAKRWRGVGMSGRLTPWHKISATPDETPTATLKGTRIPASASSSGMSHHYKQFAEQWVKVQWPALRSIDHIELVPGKGPFPIDFVIEYSVDAGKTWLRLPRSRVRHFPGPQGRRVEIPMSGLVADAVRLWSPRLPVRSDHTFGFELAGINVYAKTQMPFVNISDHARASALLNNLWLTLGTAATEIHSYGYAFPNVWMNNISPWDAGKIGIRSAEWCAWDATKLSWVSDSALRSQMAQTLSKQRIGADGYVWANAVSPKHLGFARHYTTNASYALGVAKYFLWTRDQSFLKRTGADGLNPLQRGRKALRFLLHDFDGRTGVVTIHDPKIDGTAHGLPDNYWDTWRFGYKSALLNIRTYNALRWWVQLEEALGETARAEKFRQAADRIKVKFATTFWNPQTGRVVGWIDKNGKSHDFGFTFVNVEALASGLLDDECARQVFAWLDGQRVVSTDTSTGDDIYAFGFAPRTNTVAAEKRDKGAFFFTWGGRLSVVNGPGKWRSNVQNGGAIFFVSYYDLLARLRYLGPDAALKRLKGILAQAAKDGLRRRALNRWGQPTVIGIIGPFPESGLVPVAVLSGFMGVRPTASGLTLSPHLPDSWAQLRINDVSFAGRTYNIIVQRDASATISDQGTITTPDGGKFLLTTDGKLETLGG